MRMDQRYKSGQEIHVGDRVAYNEQMGRIVLVADRGEFTEGYEWREATTGFLIEFDNGSRLFLETADSLLQVLEQSSDA